MRAHGVKVLSADGDFQVQPKVVGALEEAGLVLVDVVVAVDDLHLDGGEVLGVRARHRVAALHDRLQQQQ